MVLTSSKNIAVCSLRSLERLGHWRKLIGDTAVDAKVLFSNFPKTVLEWQTNLYWRGDD